MTHRVFLSSTFADLAEHRAAVQSGLRQLGVVDVSMEHFGARDERPADECVRLVRDESDLFVGIYAHRYGYVPGGWDCSISELEYRAASDARLPRFVYLIDENHPWLPGYIDYGEPHDRLLTFKTSLTQRHFCQTFAGKEDLTAKVVADVGRHIAMSATPKVGPGLPIQDIGIDSYRGMPTETPDEWNGRRNGVYSHNRGLFLTHVIKPSAKPGQEFDVFIYLLRHKSNDVSDVRVADFFLGPYWENKVFSAIERQGFIGISTSAYGTFLCLCRVTFMDGFQLDLERYIDFEAARVGQAEAR